MIIVRAHRWLAVLSVSLLLAAVSLTVMASEAVSPVSGSPTNQTHQGKINWIDLVTDDLQSAGTFYRDVFGWNMSYSKDGTFADVSYQGNPIATISLYNEGEAPAGEARWLISISVADVDAAASSVSSNGGKVLEGPENLDNRGRYALISDSRGALVMLLQARDGDAADVPVKDNSWLWAELWTDNPAKAAAFYESVIDYRSVAIKDASGDEILVLGRDSHPRASIVKIPWPEMEPNWLPWLQVADIVATTKAVLKHGGEIVIAPMLDADGSRVAVVADPTGGVFAIQQRAGQ